MMAAAVDHTGKHYLQKELEELFQRDNTIWNFVQQGSLDGVWYWDLENPDIEWMSPEMWQLLGVDPSTKRHDPSEWQDLIFPEDLKVALENFEKHCADPDHPYDQIVRYRHASGSTVWVRCRGIAIRDADGKAIRMLGAHNDLTAVKQAEADLLTALKASNAGNEELRSFAYSISHDLKSPTNTVKMVLNDILETDAGGLSSEQIELIGLAEQSLERMGLLVEDLLSYTRLIGQDFQTEEVALSEVADEVVRALAALLKETGGRVTIDHLPTIRASKTQISLLFHNIVENALKYHEPKRVPEIHISSTDNPPGQTTVTFQDNGQGIEVALQDRIFEMFKRLHRKDEVAGFGLGLTLCRRIALNHGGDIEVRSQPGEGSCFSVVLPKVRQ